MAIKFSDINLNFLDKEIVLKDDWKLKLVFLLRII